MKTIVSFRKLNTFDAVLITYPFVSIAYYLVNEQIVAVKNNAFLNNVLFFSGLILIGTISQIYFCYSSQTTKNNAKALNTLNNLLIKKVFKLPEHKTQKVISALIVIVLTMSTICFCYLDSFSSRKGELGNIGGFFYYIFFIIFAYVSLKLILHVNQYGHHYLALIFVIIGLIGIYFNKIAVSISILYDLLFALIAAIILSYSKVIMEKKFIQPTTLILLYGLCGIIILGIAYPIVITINYNSFLTRDILAFAASIKLLFTEWHIAFLSIIYIILNGIQSIQMVVIVYRHDPINQNMLLVLSLLLEWIFELINHFNTLYFILSLISCILLVIGVLVYVEFVTLHVFGLGENTRESIALRSCGESDQLNITLDKMLDEVKLDNLL